MSSSSSSSSAQSCPSLPASSPVKRHQQLTRQETFHQEQDREQGQPPPRSPSPSSSPSRPSFPEASASASCVNPRYLSDRNIFETGYITPPTTIPRAQSSPPPAPKRPRAPALREQSAHLQTYSFHSTSPIGVCAVCRKTRPLRDDALCWSLDCALPPEPTHLPLQHDDHDNANVYGSQRNINSRNSHASDSFSQFRRAAVLAHVRAAASTSSSTPLQHASCPVSHEHPRTRTSHHESQQPSHHSPQLTDHVDAAANLQQQRRVRQRPPDSPLSPTVLEGDVESQGTSTNALDNIDKCSQNMPCAQPSSALCPSSAKDLEPITFRSADDKSPASQAATATDVSTESRHMQIANFEQCPRDTSASLDADPDSP